MWTTTIKEKGLNSTPYILTDLSIVESKVLKLKSLLPDVEIYYAVKSNGQSKILRRLKHLVEGYDIASLGELNILKELSIEPGRVLYSNPVKVPKHIKEAFKSGVRYFALDSVDEMKKLAQYAPGVNVYIRLQVSDYGSKFPLSKKFGLSPEHAADYASLAGNLGLNVCGLAFHVGSQSENPQIWDRAFEMSGQVLKRFNEMGIDANFLDIGGGFAADYGQPIPSLTLTCRLIQKAIKKYIPKGVRIVAEPGRYVTANASVIVTEVIAREHRSGSDWLYLDMGVFQGLIEPLEMKSWRYPIFTDRSTKGYKKEFVLTGPTCDAFDTIGTDYPLSADINVGDKLYIGAAGAYSIVYGSNFNGFEIPKSYFVN